jgi:hypothetical protein
VASSNNKNVEKITSMTKYVEKMKNQKTNIPVDRQHQKEEYLAFLDLEIQKAERTIEKLR